MYASSNIIIIIQAETIMFLIVVVSEFNVSRLSRQGEERKEDPDAVQPGADQRAESPAADTAGATAKAGEVSRSRSRMLADSMRNAIIIFGESQWKKNIGNNAIGNFAL